jgi:hypothetical protein
MDVSGNVFHKERHGILLVEPQMNKYILRQQELTKTTTLIQNRKNFQVIPKRDLKYHSERKKKSSWEER